MEHLMGVLFKLNLIFKGVPLPLIILQLNAMAGSQWAARGGIKPLPELLNTCDGWVAAGGSLYKCH